MSSRSPFILLVLLAPAPLAAGPTVLNAGRVMSAARTAAAPAIDGRLDEPSWGTCTPDDRFVQTFPDEGKAPTERTEVRVLYDDRAIYVGIRAYDSAPDQIDARMTRRDRDIETDTVAVAFDSQQDRRTAYAFMLSAAGVQLDAMFYDDSNINLDWDAVWDSAVSRDERGWSAELAIPLSALRYRTGPVQDWGFQVARTVTRKKEKMSWSFRPSTVQGEVQWYGRLAGLNDLPPTRTFELRPFLVGRLAGRTTSGRSFFSGGSGAQGRELRAVPDVGIDGKLGVTSNLVLDATFNPDFGQVEADQVELNLSRFETFFPEKRPFFLEGADVYQTPIQLLYSRRIGRPLHGLGVGDTVTDPATGGALRVSEVPTSLRIWGATKLTGAVSRRLSLGVLAAVTAAEAVSGGVPADPAMPARTVRVGGERSFGALRLRYAVSDRGYLGMMATAVNRLNGHLYRADADHDAYTQGLDGFWRSGGGTVRLNGQVVVSERAGGPGQQDGDGRPCPSPPVPGVECRGIFRNDGTAMPPGAVGYGAAGHLLVRDGHLFMRGNVQSLSPRLDVNDAGFLPQFNTNHLNLVTGYNESRPTRHFQTHGIFGFGNASVTHDGVLENALVGLDLEGQFKNFVSTSPEIAFILPAGWDTRETTDGARFRKSHGINSSWWLSTDGRKPFRVAGSVWNWVSFNGGPAFGGHAEITWHASPRLQLELLPRAGFDFDTIRFYSCATPLGADCTPDTPERRYLFSELDSAFLSLTTRGTYTFSPRLTFQWYAQLFFARGEYGRFMTIDTTGARPYIRRWQLQPSPFTGDGDGDGDQDRDFQDTNLNVNAVLRWELRPGSALYAVYTRTQAAEVTLGPGARPRFSLSGLQTGPTEDVLMAKLVWFIR